jgi:hypothetical protein
LNAGSFWRTISVLQTAAQIVKPGDFGRQNKWFGLPVEGEVLPGA